MKKNAIVAGTGFDGREQIIRKYCKKGLKVTLKREPKNEHDENAIAVYLEIPVLFGVLGKSSKQIGYIKATTAKSIAEKMDKGQKFTASVISYFAPSEKDHPRVSIEVTDQI